MFEGPKSVLSNMTILSLCRSCMCMGDMPRLSCRRVHLPLMPEVFCGGVSGMVVVGGKASSVKRTKLVNIFWWCLLGNWCV